MRVLRLLTRANLGGPARQMRSLAPHFARLGVDEIIAVGELAPGETELELTGGEVHAPAVVRVAGMRRGLSPLQDRKAVRSLIGLVREERVELLHTHTAKAGLLGVRVARRCGIPLVHSFHGHVLRDYFHPALSTVFTLLERRLAARRDVMTCVSASCRAELAELGVVDSKHAVVVAPAVQSVAAERVADEDRAALRAEFELGDDFAVAWCGRLEAVKDPDLLCDVLRELAATRSASPGAKGCVQVRIFGGGSLECALRVRLEQLRASFDGVLDVRAEGPNPRFPEVIGGFDVLLSTSRREGCPVSAIEALLSGVPVVAPSVPGFVDLEGSGVALTAREPRALSEALFAVEPPTSARRRALASEHDPGAVAQRYVEIYQRILSGG